MKRSHDMKVPHQELVARMQETRAALKDALDAGDRNFEALDGLFEQYKSFLSAADVLEGYMMQQKTPFERIQDGLRRSSDRRDGTMVGDRS